MVIKKILVDTYHQGIYFCITPDREQAREWFENHHIKTSNFPTHAAGFTWTLKGYFPHIWLPSLDLTPEMISTIAHELIHACWFILDSVGIKIQEDNHEALTYLQGYFMSRLLKKK